MANKNLLLAVFLVSSSSAVFGLSISQPAETLQEYIYRTVFKISASGVGVYLPGFPGTVNAGSDSLPSNLDCNLATQPVACRICNSDCLAVHNTYGGSCTTNLRNGAPDYAKTVCFCQDTQNPNGNLTSTTALCGLLPSNLGTATDSTTDAAIGAALIGRELGTLCHPILDATNVTVVGYESTGCDSDCKTNHQYDSGVCKMALPVQRYATDPTPTKTQLFCICSYSNGDPNNYPAGDATNVPLVLNPQGSLLNVGDLGLGNLGR